MTHNNNHISNNTTIGTGNLYGGGTLNCHTASGSGNRIKSSNANNNINQLQQIATTKNNFIKYNNNDNNISENQYNSNNNNNINTVHAAMNYKGSPDQTNNDKEAYFFNEKKTTETNERLNTETDNMSVGNTTSNLISNTNTQASNMLGSRDYSWGKVINEDNTTPANPIFSMKNGHSPSEASINNNNGNFNTSTFRNRRMNSGTAKQPYINSINNAFEASYSRNKKSLGLENRNQSSNRQLLNSKYSLKNPDVGRSKSYKDITVTTETNCKEALQVKSKRNYFYTIEVTLGLNQENCLKKPIVG